MDTVLRGAAVYLFLILIFRISGKRSLAEVTTFDFVLILIVAETAQQALLGEDFSVTNAFILITTLMGLDIGLSLLKERFTTLDRVMDGLPLVIVEQGKPIQLHMKKSRVDEADVLEAARRLQGLERMEQIKYAVLERNGGITIIPA